MLKLVQNFCKVTAVGLLIGGASLGEISQVLAAEDPGDETQLPLIPNLREMSLNETPSLLAEIHPLLEVTPLATNLNEEIMAHFSNGRWQEVVDLLPQVKQLLLTSSGKQAPFTYDTFHTIGQAHLNGYTFAGKNADECEEGDNPEQYTLQKDEYNWQAIRFFSYCAGIFPHTVSASNKVQAVVWAWLGLCHVAAGDTHAYEKYEKALALDKNLDLFFAEFFKKPTENEAEVVAQPLGVTPLNGTGIFQIQDLNPLLYENAGRLYFEQKNWEMAIANFEAAARTKALEFIPSYLQWGIAYLSVQRFEKALEKFEYAIERSTEVPEEIKNIVPQLYEQAGAIYCTQKNWKMSIEKFEAAAKLGELNDPANYVNWGIAYGSLENFIKASEKMEIALIKNPHLPGEVKQFAVGLKNLALRQNVIQ